MIPKWSSGLHLSRRVFDHTVLEMWIMNRIALVVVAASLAAVCMGDAASRSCRRSQGGISAENLFG